MYTKGPLDIALMAGMSSISANTHRLFCHAVGVHSGWERATSEGMKLPARNVAPAEVLCHAVVDH